MGGSESVVDNRRQIHGSISIQVNKFGFIGGELIQGVLNISLQETFPGNILQVSLVGIENTHFTYEVTTGSGEDQSTTTYHARGVNKFLDFAIPVYDFATNDYKNQGQWQIPFQISIANQLPSSFIYDEGDSDCSLKYQVVGTLISTNNDVRHLIGYQEILIAQQLNLLLSESLEQIVTPSACCCCSFGLIKITAKTDKAAYAPGETAFVTFNCNLNNFSQDLKTLRVKIIGILTMKATGTTETKEIIIDVSSAFIQIKGKLFSEQTSHTIPPNTGLTCSGDLIKVEYKAEVTPVFDTCYCCVEVKPVRVPIRINPTPTNLNMIKMPQVIQGNVPARWNPTMLQPTIFSEQQNFTYQKQQTLLKQQESQMISQYLVQNNNGEQKRLKSSLL